MITVFKPAGFPSQGFLKTKIVDHFERQRALAEGGGVLVGESTYRLVRDAVSVEAVEPLAAKGKSAPLTAYRLLEVASARSESGRAPG